MWRRFKEGVKMDARELTKEYTRLSNDLFTTKKQVEYLTQELEKLRMLVDDMKIDVRMLSRQRGGRT
jgi:ribosomal protein S15P/S13E